MKNRVRTSFFVLAATLAAVAVMVLAPRGDAPVRVKTCRVSQGNVEQALCVTGRVRYDSEYAAIAPCAGIVRQVYVAPGDHVEAGQPLFRLDGAAQEAALSALLADAAQVSSLVQAERLDQSGSLAQSGSLPLPEAALLSQLTVRAQCAGVVHQVAVVENGGVIAGDAGALLSGDTQKIVASVVARDALRVKRGMAARLLVPGGGCEAARVVSVSPIEVDPLTGQTVAQITLAPEETLALPIGAALDVEIVLATRENVPTLPLEAVSDTGTVRWVADGRCYEIPVTVLLRDEVRCWVALPEGEEIVLEGRVAGAGERVKE